MEKVTSIMPKGYTLNKHQQIQFSGQNMLAFQRHFGARNWPMVHYKSSIMFDSAHTF
jgi:hypothetical protein